MPIPNFDKVLVADAYKVSPVVKEVSPVPPNVGPMTVPFQTPVAIVPTPVIPVYDPEILPEAIVPVKAPASTEPEEEIVKPLSTSLSLIQLSQPPLPLVELKVEELEMVKPEIEISVPATKLIAPVLP